MKNTYGGETERRTEKQGREMGVKKTKRDSHVEKEREREAVERLDA